jgi:hypothetical protein
MALQFVGENSAVKAGATSGNSTVSLTALTGGIASSAAAGDLVIAVFATGSTADRALTITDGTNNYTLIDAELYSNGTSYDTNLRVAYKRLTAADTSVTFGPTGNAQDAGAMAVHVWRNVDSTTPLDVAAVPATNTGTGRPDPAAITPTTSGAVIVVVGAGAAATGAVYTASYLSGFISETSTDTNDAMLGIGYVTWTSGQYNPAAWTGGTTNAADSWAAMTIALRPMIKDTSGTLTGQIGSISGSAVYVAKHTTSGTLAGQGSTVVGSALHNIPHPTSGVLSGQGSNIVGSATKFRVHDNTGSLTGQLGSIVGSARLNIPHSTTGILTGQNSTVVGSSTRYRIYVTSGTLTGQGSSISGDADREPQSLPHTTEGALTGQGSIVTGDADREPQDLAHIALGSLVGLGSVVSGSASREGVAQSIAGGTSNPQRKSRLIIVDVDGKEYRVPIAQLDSFLQAIKVEAKQEAKQTIKKSKKKKQIVEQVFEPYVKIEIKSIPVKSIPSIFKKIENTNIEIHNIFYLAMQKYLRDADEEEEEILLLAM